MRREWFILMTAVFLWGCSQKPTLDVMPPEKPTALPSLTAPPPTATEFQISTLDAEARGTVIAATLEVYDVYKTLEPEALFEKPRNLVSPDGNLVAAEFYETDPNDPYSMELRIIDRDGKVFWIIPYEWGVFVEPHPVIMPYQWSDDSKSLYYLEYGGGEGGYEPLYDGNGLWRIDIDTGDITWMVPCSGYKAFEFSKDEKNLAYICQNSKPFEIVIRNQETNEERAWDIPFEAVESYQGGEINWSPDGEELVFFVTDTQTYETNLYFLNLLENEITMITEKLKIEIYSVEWTEDDSLIITGYSLGQSRWLEIDLQTGELTSIE